MKQLFFIAVTFAALTLAKADPPFPGVPYELIGTLDEHGHPHMKKGYHYYWHKVLEYDDYGNVRVRDEMVVTYRGRRVTD